ncbi:hypothetical protein C8R44DRAFT_876415 [Mycena epipterygia]|nr:hypothetical protein C8R44DRAFT_876415 [Mycena epipterygia]
MPASLFSKLAPDIIISIFAYCDISTVVSTGQTCRYLHGLAFHKAFWRVLVKDLQRRGFLVVSTLDLQGLSTDDLITLVKRPLTGPKTRTPRDEDFVPEVSRKITVHPRIAVGLAHRPRENEAKLLRTDECAAVLAFAVDDTGDYDSLILMICQRTYPWTAENRKNHVEIVDLDLTNGTRTLLLTANAPDTYTEKPFSYPKVCGTLAAVAITSQHRYLVVDWKAQFSFELCCDLDVSRLALIP